MTNVQSCFASRARVLIKAMTVCFVHTTSAAPTKTADQNFQATHGRVSYWHRQSSAAHRLRPIPALATNHSLPNAFITAESQYCSDGAGVGGGAAAGFRRLV